MGKQKRIVLFLPVNAYFSKLDPLTFRLDEISALNKTMQTLGKYHGMHVSLKLLGIQCNSRTCDTKNFDNFELSSLSQKYVRKSIFFQETNIFKRLLCVTYRSMLIRSIH